MPNLSERKILFAGREAALRKPELREIVTAKGLLMSRCPASPLAAPKAAPALDGFNGHRPDPPVPEEGDRRNTKIALRSLPSGGTAGQNAMKASHINKLNGEMTMSQKASLPSKLTKVDANTQFTEAYVRQMANELAELARSAGCRRLATLFALASIEAETHPPVSPLTRYPTASSINAIKRPELRASPCKPKARPSISGMDAVDKIKKGAKEDGAVTAPDKIVKVQLAADAAPGKK